MNMPYLAPPVGSLVTLIAYGVDMQLLNDQQRLTEIFLEALRADNFKILKTLAHSFEPVGFTLVAIIAESHATLHTYPEYQTLIFSLYTCRGPQDGEVAVEHLKTGVQPRHIAVYRQPIAVKNEGFTE